MVEIWLIWCRWPALLNLMQGSFKRVTIDNGRGGICEVGGDIMLRGHFWATQKVNAQKLCIDIMHCEHVGLRRAIYFREAP